MGRKVQKLRAPFILPHWPNRRRSVFFLLGVILPSAGLAAPAATPDPFFLSEKEACQKLLANISPEGTLRGTVIASPSRADPNYYFHWIRDGALVMDVVRGCSEGTADLLFEDFIALSEIQQNLPNLSGGLGEPRFEVGGQSSSEDWGRPQGDGPALRASLLIRNWDGREVTRRVIERDLEFVARHWRDRTFDLWEETRGLSFYTLMVQRRALQDGQRWSKNTSIPIDWEREIRAIRSTLERFWDPGLGYLRGHLEETPKFKHPSGLDLSVILAAIHAADPADEFGVIDDRVLATALELRRRFEREYAINQLPELAHLGPAIGRYPEDTYDGVRVNTRGNPWYLATSAFSELHFRAAAEWSKRGKIRVSPLNAPFFESLTAMTGKKIPLETLDRKNPLFHSLIRALLQEGDRYLARVQYHMSPDGRMAEQFHRDGGFPQGARDLTWSYAAWISARRARGLALETRKCSPASEGIQKSFGNLCFGLPIPVEVKGEFKGILAARRSVLHEAEMKTIPRKIDHKPVAVSGEMLIPVGRMRVVSHLADQIGDPVAGSK